MLLQGKRMGEKRRSICFVTDAFSMEKQEQEFEEEACKALNVLSLNLYRGRSGRVYQHQRL